MAISFPVWQAQLMRLQGAPQPQSPVWGPPDVTTLLQRGAEGIGKALRQPDEDRREQEKIDLHRQQIEAAERYQQGRLGIEQGELALKAQQQAAWGAMASELGGLGGPYGPVAPGPPGAGGGGGAPGNASLGTPSLPRFAQGTLDPFKSAVGSIESGNNYGAVGPTHPKYGRALGYYQVMESNLPEWSQEALGRKVSPEEFLASPAIQDRVFEHKFGNYLKIYGNPQDAASMWHSGRPLSVAAQARAKDSLGTSTTDYVSRFTQALGGTGMPGPAAPAMAAAQSPMMPQQVASLDPTAGLVPPPMPGTPAPPPVNPQAKARDIGTQQQSVPGPALFPNPPTLPPGPGGPGMQLPPEAGGPPGPPGGPPAPSLPQPLSPPPPPVQTAQAAPAGVREVVPAQTQAGGIDRNSPQVRGFLAKAMAAGPEAFNAAVKYLDAIAPTPTGRFTNSERGVFDTHTGRLVAPPAQIDGSAGIFGNSLEGRAAEIQVARGRLTVDQALDVIGGKVIGAPGGEQRFVTPQELVGPVPGGPSPAPPATGVGRQIVPPSAKEEIPSGELAARIGLGNRFLGDTLPVIRRYIDEGALEGFRNTAKYFAGIDKAGEVGRGLAAGADALLRNLTGAGMSEAEASRYAARYGYRPPIESVKDLRLKLNELEGDLKTTRDAILAGRRINSRELKGWENNKAIPIPSGGPPIERIPD